MKDRKKEYEVHWKGFPKSDDTWVKERDMKNAQDIIKAYEYPKSETQTPVLLRFSMKRAGAQTSGAETGAGVENKEKTKKHLGENLQVFVFPRSSLLSLLSVFISGDNYK
jgi:hypothetical protein